jgi:hypothetical protein
MLPIKLVQKNYDHYIDDSVEVCFDNCGKIDYAIHIVYYINCDCNENWFSWLFNQINLVVTMNATIYIVSTLQPSKENEFREKVLQHFPNVIIECYYENEYEYRGIKKYGS